MYIVAFGKKENVVLMQNGVRFYGMVDLGMQNWPPHSRGEIKKDCTCKAYNMYTRQFCFLTIFCLFIVDSKPYL